MCMTANVVRLDMERIPILGVLTGNILNPQPLATLWIGYSHKLYAIQ